MISVILETLDQEAQLADTLRALVEGAVAGVILDVTIIDGGSGDETLRLAEAAGCKIFERGQTGKAIRSARADWLLILEPGTIPTGDWIGSVHRHMAPLAQPVSQSVIGQSRASALLRSIRVRIIGWRRQPASLGVLISKTKAFAQAGSGLDLQAISRTGIPIGLKN